MSKQFTEEEVKVVIEEKLKGTGSRKIGSIINRSKSAVNYVWNRVKGDIGDIEVNGPKIFLFDIETSTILAHVWGLFNQNISIDAIEDDWYTFCFSGKWLGQDTFNHSVHHYEYPESGNFKDNERYVVEAMWKYLDECDIAVAYNGKKFDKKKMNWKFFEYNLPEPSSYKLIDPYQIVKGNFSPTSGKLDFIQRYIKDISEGKKDTGMKLWKACRNNDVESLDYMVEYCDQDIELLEKVYLAVRHWDKNSPQMSLYYDDDKLRCNSCGSDDLSLIEDKVTHTSLSEFPLYRCNCCSKVMRGRTNLLTKEKRKNLVMNVK